VRGRSILSILTAPHPDPPPPCKGGRLSVPSSACGGRLGWGQRKKVLTSNTRESWRAIAAG
jgi:hypothetical protein